MRLRHREGYIINNKIMCGICEGCKTKDCGGCHCCFNMIKFGVN